MLGLKPVIKRQKYVHFSEAERRTIIEDYLQSGLSRRAIWEKHTGQTAEHGVILNWMSKYGYSTKSNAKNATFVAQKSSLMKKQELVPEFEYLQLQKRVLELENQLKEAEMKSLAWQTMVEIAERELKVNIKKNFYTKPLKK